jgi:hypothetical protein
MKNGGFKSSCFIKAKQWKGCDIGKIKINFYKMEMERIFGVRIRRREEKSSIP